MEDLGLYIHIPFCKKKCSYCDFISFANKDEVIKKYVETLKNEIINIKDRANDRVVDTIYFGGGTPSYIDCSYIVEILETIKENFNIKNDAEITIEVNPGTVDSKKLECYKMSGINRLSIGLQETNNDLLKLIGRIHSYEEFVNTYNMARKVGFENINVDLMIGLPNQTLKDVDNSLEKIINLDPNHVSVYSLIVEEKTPIQEKIENGELSLPKEELERKEYWLVKKKLEKTGYKHYEISNFAKEGFQSKHNLNCWFQKEYFGFGVASHSYYNQERYSNVESIEEYLNGAKYIVNEKQTQDDAMKEYMMLGLRKIDGIKISEFKNKFGLNPIMEFKDELNKLVNDKLLEVDLDDIRLTKKGIDLANIVWEEFI